MKKLAVVLFVSFVAVSASASNWVLSSTNPEEELYSYVDTESISTQGNYKQAFVKMIDTPKGVYYITLFSYDCRSNPRRIKPTHITTFDLEGDVIASRPSGDASFFPILPDSQGEGQANTICNL